MQSEKGGQRDLLQRKEKGVTHSVRVSASLITTVSEICDISVSATLFSITKTIVQDNIVCLAGMELTCMFAALFTTQLVWGEAPDT